MNIDTNPPRWLERLLALLLSDRDRETITGDLYEEYSETKLPRLGRSRANLWYARQILSLAPSKLLSSAAQTPLLSLLCTFTALCGLWLGVMDIVLHHAGYASRELISGMIVWQALLALFATTTGRLASLRPYLVAGCFGVLYLAAGAFVGLIRGAHFEGYILLICAALTAQAVLTFTALSRDRTHPKTAR